jgi:hypothetical protein
MKVCAGCGVEISTRDGDNKCEACEHAGPKQKKQARRKRAQIDDVMASLGLTKVRGAMGGTYYE